MHLGIGRWLSLLCFPAGTSVDSGPSKPPEKGISISSASIHHTTAGSVMPCHACISVRCVRLSRMCSNIA